MKHYRRIVRATFKEWIYKLGLGDWSIDTQFVSEITNASGPLVVAKTTADWKYRYAKIEIKKSQIKECSRKEIEDIVVHELGHCLVNEMWNAHQDSDHEERVVTHLTHAFLWTRDDLKP